MAAAAGWRALCSGGLSAAIMVAYRHSDGVDDGAAGLWLLGVLIFAVGGAVALAQAL
jgi:hypothetical protein